MSVMIFLINSCNSTFYLLICTIQSLTLEEPNPLWCSCEHGLNTTNYNSTPTLHNNDNKNYTNKVLGLREKTKCVKLSNIFRSLDEILNQKEVQSIPKIKF